MVDAPTLLGSASMVSDKGEIMDRLRSAVEDLLPILERWKMTYPPCAGADWDKVEALRQALEQSRQETKHGAYAGVIIWLGDKRVAKLITETEIKYEREAGFVITEVAQSCLDELAEAEKHK